MDIVGYIGYAVLVFFAVTWLYGVRTQLGAGAFTILGALYFLLSAIVIPVFNINMLHTLWVIPGGFLFVYIVTMILIHVPIWSFLLRSVAGIFSGIVRLGIPRERIEKEKATSIRNFVDDYFR